MRHCRALSQSHRALGPVRLTVRAVPFSHGPARRNIGSSSGRGGFTRLVAGGICPAIGGGLHRNRPGAQIVTALLVPLAGPERNIAECPKDYEISAAVQTSFSWSNPAIAGSALPNANTASSSLAFLPAADGRRMRCCHRRRRSASAHGAKRPAPAHRPRGSLLAVLAFRAPEGDRRIWRTPCRNGLSRSPAGR